MMIEKAFVAAAACFAIAALGASASAEEYPSGPVQIVVPAGAGGGTDVLVRTLQPHLEEALGGTIVVLNVPGSGSVGGSRRVYEADPDGYTVLANHVTLLTAMALGKADFKHPDFELAATAVAIPLVVVVPASSDIETLDQLMAKAKGDGDPVIAGVNLGAVNHFSMLMLQAKGDGASFRFVQTGGGAATTAALLGEHIDVGVLAGSETLPIVESGDVRVIAALGGERISYFPDVATAIEQGYDVTMGVEYFWFMPGGTPADRVEAFGAALKGALAKPEIVEALEKRGMIPSFATGKDSQGKLDSLYATIEGIAAAM
jgi:tripartite-type tricarboxylate transporter receptor subunit TctC